LTEGLAESHLLIRFGSLTVVEVRSNEINIQRLEKMD
jgi:hypothetical protein